jgi:hypothetical protein
LNAYESFSRVRGIPLVGKPIFGIFDRLGHIPEFYPIRMLDTAKIKEVSATGRPTGSNSPL